MELSPTFPLSVFGDLGEALDLVSKMLLPKVIDGSVVKAYVKKAVRTGVWRFLRAESRALLRALSSWGRVVKSRVLRSIVTGILLEIEFSTLKGKAVLCGALLVMRNGLLRVFCSAETLLCLGISYLGNSPLFRSLG